MSVDQELADGYRAMIREDMKLDEPIRTITLGNRLCAAHEIPELVAIWNEETGTH